MPFETKKDILDWYERQPRALTNDFISAIAWDDVRRHPIDKRFIPVLIYMRDVEALTDMYYAEMRRTPTGRDPVISKFMERWGIEELAHAEVLNRFLGEFGVLVDPDWKSTLRRSVSRKYRFNTYLINSLTNLVGSKFTATHMTFGAIHEMTTAQGYRRMMDLANHPVLTSILKAIVREESAHTQPQEESRDKSYSTFGIRWARARNPSRIPSTSYLLYSEAMTACAYLIKPSLSACRDYQGLPA